MFKNLLANMGLGQADLINVFNETLDRLTKQDITTPELKKGRVQAILEMMNVLRDGDVMSNDTYRTLTSKLIAWQNQ